MRSLPALLLSSLVAVAQSSAPASPTQTEADEYTRYELLAPETLSFRIRYEVTATTTGAKYYFNPIRKGSVATDESVVDAMTGEQLKFEVVPGAEAVKDPLLRGEDQDVDYIKVQLARPCRRMVAAASSFTRRTKIRRAISGRATPSCSTGG
jgi:hypothetical protein